MKSSNKALLLLGAAVLAVAIPALAQNRDAPESLLPEGFGDPGSLPPPEKAGPRAAPDGPSAPVAERADEIVQELNGSTAVVSDSGTGAPMLPRRAITEPSSVSVAKVSSTVPW